MARTARVAARTRRLLPRAARREAILQAAARAFARTGHVHTSMEDIAAAAGITKLIVYRHFTSKEVLYRAVLQGVFDRLAAQLKRGPEAGGYGVGAQALLAVARGDEAGFRLLWRHAGREPRFARYADELRRRAVSAVRSALAGHVPREHLEWAAHAVVGYLVEAVLNWLEFGDPARDEQFAAATNQALRAGVRAWARPNPTVPRRTPPASGRSRS
jgi:AcrR family transcriptional regulator